jgi:hypothetical protein
LLSAFASDRVTHVLNLSIRRRSNWQLSLFVRRIRQVVEHQPSRHAEKDVLRRNPAGMLVSNTQRVSQQGDFRRNSLTGIRNPFSSRFHRGGFPNRVPSPAAGRTLVVRVAEPLAHDLTPRVSQDRAGDESSAVNSILEKR